MFILILLYAYVFSLLLFCCFIALQNCNTVTGTIEGTAIGVVKDVKSFGHYSTCIFTDTECGDLDLD